MPDVVFLTKVVIIRAALTRVTVINLSWGAFIKVMAGALTHLI
jgi:hypothetical protein